MKLASFRKRLLLTIVFAICLFGLAELRSQSSPILAQKRGTDMPCDFKGMIGVISFVNDSNRTIEVTLWHSRTRTVLSSWEFAPGESAYLNYQDNRIRIGDDWGIQLGSSRVKCVGSVSSYKDKEFEVTASSFYR
jgi:hypothetical protein